MSPESNNKKKTLKQIAEKFKNAMLTSKQEGRPGLNARPMNLLKVHEDGMITFMTNIGDNKVDEILSDPHVCVTMQDGQRCVSIGGSATISQDRERIRELWKPHFNLWLEGPDAPSTALIDVRPESGEFWDATPESFFDLVVNEAKSFVGLAEDIDWDNRIHGRVEFKSGGKKK